MKWYIGKRIQSRSSGSVRNGASTAASVLRARLRQQAARPIRSANVFARGTGGIGGGQQVGGDRADVGGEIEGVIRLARAAAAGLNLAGRVDEPLHRPREIVGIAFAHDEAVLSVTNEVGHAAPRADDDGAAERH